MSPVCSMNSGTAVSPLILSTAAFSVPATSGLAGLLNPIWLSLICTKLSSPLASVVLNSERRLRLYDFNTPPCITQKAPVPAQAMHFRQPRRLTPSLLWSCKSSSFFLSDILALLVCMFPRHFLGVLLRTAPRGFGGARDRRSTCFVYLGPTHKPIYSRLTRTLVIRPLFIGGRRERIKSGLRRLLLMRSHCSEGIVSELGLEDRERF